MAMWKIEFSGADTPARKALITQGHAFVSALKGQKRSGDHVKIHAPDGTVHEVTIGSASTVGDNFVIECPEGRES
jgi:hypothetical protein